MVERWYGQERYRYAKSGKDIDIITYRRRMWMNPIRVAVLMRVHLQ